MIRVAALLDTSNVSGPARQLMASQAPLRDLGIELCLFAMHPASVSRTPFIQYLAEHGHSHVAIPTFGKLARRTLHTLAEAIEQFSPAIVQTHAYRPNMHALALRKLGLVRRPWVGFFHGTTAENRMVRLYHRLDRWVLSQCDDVFLVSRAQRSQLGRLRRFAVVDNAILPPPPHADIPRETGLVLYAGRLSHEKGVDVLLDGWDTVQRAHPEARLIVLGDGPARESLVAHASGLAASDSVTFLPFDPAPWALYRRSSLVVLPSRSEGMPNVLLEALALGTRVVATDVGSVSEIAGSPAAFPVVPSENPGALASAIIQQLTASADDEARWSHDCASILARYSLTHRAQVLAAHYRRIAESPAAGSG